MTEEMKYYKNNNNWATVKCIIDATKTLKMKSEDIHHRI